jgi:hypothetical protein
MKNLILEGSTVISEKTGTSFPLRAEIANEGKGGITLYVFIADEWRMGYEFFDRKNSVLKCQFDWTIDGQECILKGVVNPVGQLAQIIDTRINKRREQEKQREEDKKFQMWGY